MYIDDLLSYNFSQGVIMYKNDIVIARLLWEMYTDYPYRKI